MGIDLAGYKVKSFAISAALTGMAGVLFAHKMSFISPEMFTLLLSIEFIMVIIIGGAFRVHGAVLGAIFIVMVDPFLTALKDDVPGWAPASLTLRHGGMPSGKLRDITNVGDCFGAGLKGAIYGLIIMMFILFEPLRPLRPLAQDQALLPAVPALQEARPSSGRRPT
jgi:branched-chain amino acid transport system permease protein